MVSAASFAGALLAYRARAAERFSLSIESLKSTRTSQSLDLSTTATTATERYERCIFPALQDYIEKAAANYRSKKDTLPMPLAVKRSQNARVLGSGKIFKGLAAELRRARWIVSRAVEYHRKRAIYKVLFDIVDACGIPIDVRQKAQENYLHRDERVRGIIAVGERLGCGEVEGFFVERKGLDERGFALHVERCRQGLSNGLTGLVGNKRTCVRLDTFEEVKKLYSGKPDEMYKRKTARRFATFRRHMREMKAAQLQILTGAETEMKRRRGHDHLLTARKTGDPSFAPFLFELDSNAYAFSSKITEAPKMRKVMVAKYSKVDDSANGMDTWEKAQHKAETSPLFHTRVMNRFS